MRVYKSNDGLYRPVKSNIKSANSQLMAASNVNLSIPSGFAYGSRLRNLDSKISKWTNRLNKMANDLESTDKTYYDLITEESNNISNISEIRLSRRRGVKDIGE